ncbi:hypothetical protein MKQ70_16680 [Chitinophaga sedimenti]|uniref:hypothetical protein n=1 Tax=Chitinophaga sedimenti TaxID=2033606 RepID=UPI002003C56E|nr:hypothetical protein [Chitinophaga sedimenti]MCK7556564.1 hypothetical protein [Chitinophaga sedimenti]
MTIKEMQRAIIARQEYLDLSREHLALLTSKNIKTVSTALNGSEKASIGTLMKIADILGLRFVIEVKQPV